jgi:hypothetical protein
MDDELDLNRTAVKLERAADEAHSRYAGSPESERIDGIVAALREALGGEPETAHSALLDRMAEWYPPVPPRIDDPAAAAELLALRAEVERLRQQPSIPPPRGDFDTASLLEALLGRDAERVTREGGADADRITAIVQLLASFATDLAKGFLGAAGKAGETAIHLDRFKSTLRGELSGKSPAGSLKTLLDEIKLKVAAQLEAVPTACSDGARQILKELDPLVLQDQAGEKGVRIAGLRPFQHRELWETFQRRHAELMSAEDLYQTYFDGPLRRALYRLQERK